MELRNAAPGLGTDDRFELAAGGRSLQAKGGFAQSEHGLSERWACTLMEVDRSSYVYEPRLNRNIELREELLRLARQKPRYGHRRLHVLLERCGHAVNEKRVYWLYVGRRLERAKAQA